MSLADKVHNARCTVNDLETDGTKAWQRFNSTSADQLWWYGSLVKIFCQHARHERADTARVAERIALRPHVRTDSGGVGARHVRMHPVGAYQ